MFARPSLVLSRKAKPSSFHAGRRQMHIVDSVTENRCCSQATSIRCSTHVKQMRRHSKTWQWRAREHAQKAVEDGAQVDTTHHGGISSSQAHHFHNPIVTMHVTVKSCRSTAWRISLTRTALLLLLLLGHCSIPHSNVVVVAAICGVGIFASGDLGLLARRCSVSWGLNLLLGRMSGVVSVVVSAISALAAIALLLQYVSADHSVKKGRARTTASTFSMIARLARSMACLVPTSPISRSMSRPDAGETLILQPVEFCISLIDSPPVFVSKSRDEIQLDTTYPFL